MTLVGRNLPGVTVRHFTGMKLDSAGGKVGCRIIAIVMN